MVILMVLLYEKNEKNLKNMWSMLSILGGYECIYFHIQLTYTCIYK